MSEFDKESFSALLDNEADELELRRLLKSCEQDPSLLETWERYSLVQSVLHESAVPVSVSLSEKIAAQIESEPVPSSAPAVETAYSWRQGLGKIAIAASVAVVFMVTIQVSLDNGATSVPAVVQQGAQQGAQPGTQQGEASTQPVSFVAENSSSEVDPIASENLRKYIESMTFDEQEPIRTEHIQDSPLYRLVNELEEKP